MIVTCRDAEVEVEVEVERSKHAARGLLPAPGSGCAGRDLHWPP